MDTGDFWNLFGVALVILAVCVGIGKCSQFAYDGDNVAIEREKTRQLELQLQIAKETNR